jgi:hypothetical protein
VSEYRGNTSDAQHLYTRLQTFHPLARTVVGLTGKEWTRRRRADAAWGVWRGVQSASAQCMTATATTTNEVMWTETACAQSANLPTMCRQANPEETASTILPGAYRAEADVAEGALSMPVIFLFGCVAGAAVVVAGTYRKQLGMMRGSRRAAGEPGTEKSPLVTVATSKTESHGYTQV